MESFPEIKLHRDSAFLEEYQDKTRYKISLEYDDGTRNSKYVGKSEWKDFKNHLSNRDDFKEISHLNLRGVVLLAGIGLLLLGILFSLTLALLFVGIPIGGIGLAMISLTVNWTWRFEYVGQDSEETWQEFGEKFS